MMFLIKHRQLLFFLLAFLLVVAVLAGSYNKGQQHAKQACENKHKTLQVKRQQQQQVMLNDQRIKQQKTQDKLDVVTAKYLQQQQQQAQKITPIYKQVVEYVTHKGTDNCFIHADAKRLLQQAVCTGSDATNNACNGFTAAMPDNHKPP